MKYDALLVVDVQTALVQDEPYNKAEFVDKLQQLLTAFRQNHIPVIYVRHDGGTGDDLAYGSIGWSIDDAVAPLAQEIVIDKKHNSSFRNTALRMELDKINAKNIVLCGMQTEHCIDATCKVAFEYGYDVTIVSGTTTTFDNGVYSGENIVDFYENKIWNNRYAELIPIKEIIDHGVTGEVSLPIDKKSLRT